MIKIRFSKLNPLSAKFDTRVIGKGLKNAKFEQIINFKATVNFRRESLPLGCTGIFHY